MDGAGGLCVLEGERRGPVGLTGQNAEAVGQSVNATLGGGWFAWSDAGAVEICTDHENIPRSLTASLAWTCQRGPSSWSKRPLRSSKQASKVSIREAGL